MVVLGSRGQRRTRREKLTKVVSGGRLGYGVASGDDGDAADGRRVRVRMEKKNAVRLSGCAFQYPKKGNFGQLPILQACQLKYPTFPTQFTTTLIGFLHFSESYCTPI
ncbi:hypothetical protein QR680_002753 [Steinernema hermaphroditum]|uniref:Uncharacterized protein n=1 Tax=Steinernema hermaphroditum TaxID=289476 RepID=A0AA39LIY8_9BILA|nr:hypothetical protein QR680_002753 [Steinernema hermaphroditum]